MRLYITSGIANKGFSSLRNSVPYLKVCNGGCGCSPPSLTGHTAKRYAQTKNGNESENKGQSGDNRRLKSHRERPSCAAQKVLKERDYKNGEPPRGYVVHHVKPLAEGGKDTGDNLDIGP